MSIRTRCCKHLRDLNHHPHFCLLYLFKFQDVQHLVYPLRNAFAGMLAGDIGRVVLSASARVLSRQAVGQHWGSSIADTVTSAPAFGGWGPALGTSQLASVSLSGIAPRGDPNLSTQSWVNSTMPAMRRSQLDGTFDYSIRQGGLTGGLTEGGRPEDVQQKQLKRSKQSLAHYQFVHRFVEEKRKQHTQFMDVAHQSVSGSLHRDCQH